MSRINLIKKAICIGIVGMMCVSGAMPVLAAENSMQRDAEVLEVTSEENAEAGILKEGVEIADAAILLKFRVQL